MILKGYMMQKITLEEKVKLITAYAEGKIVDAYDTIFQRWFAKGTDTWDFDREEYRIRPNSAPKFKVGDKLVFKSDESRMNIGLYKVTEVTQESYTLDDMRERTLEHVEKEFINVREVLWYFEIYDYAAKKYTMHPTRMTIPEMDRELASNNTLSWEPIYALGFKIKGN